jgi:hypothetical protein
MADPVKCPNSSCESNNVRLQESPSNYWICAVCMTGFYYVTNLGYEVSDNIEEAIEEIEESPIDKTIKKALNEKLTKFPGGATRSSDADNERYDLCPSIWQKRDAIIMAEGAITHGPDNWKSGIPINVCLNHLERHLNLWKSGDRTEDHLAKIRVNAGFIMYFEEENLNVRDADSTEDDVIIAEFDYKYPRHKSPSNNETY